AWPRFRGGSFDNVSRDDTPLARTWPEAGPPKLWEVELGEGHAGPAVLDGRVYVLDYDRANQADVMRCLSLADGKDIWRFSYPIRIKRYHGMSRTVPAVTDKYVLGLGPKCHVTCLDAVTGKLLWAIDLPTQYGTTVPEWYAGQCPLIDGDRAILAPGGPEALMMAVECSTGQVVWKTPNPRRWGMTYSSIVPMSIAGRRTYVYCTTGGVVGIDAESGKILWEYDKWRIRIANVPTPVVLPDGRILLTGGNNAGAMMLRIRVEGDRLVPEKLYHLKHEVFSSHQQSPILYKGHVYGVRQDGQLVCLALDGKVVWASGSDHTFGLGPFLIADGMLFLQDGPRDKAGPLVLAEATSEGFKPLTRAQVLNGHDAWGPMAIVKGRLLVRDLKKMVCLDVRR
ncbi:hypothetical protein LCGC14_2539900, partial [marine sediment metagenome]